MAYYNNYHDGVYLSVLPVCECGEVIRDLSWQQVIERCKDAKGITVAKHYHIEFDPVCCPFCGQTIRGLQVSNEFFNMFKE
jgi:hypothetical protein